MRGVHDTRGDSQISGKVIHHGNRVLSGRMPLAKKFNSSGLALSLTKAQDIGESISRFKNRWEARIWCGAFLKLQHQPKGATTEGCNAAMPKSWLRVARQAEKNAGY